MRKYESALRFRHAVILAVAIAVLVGGNWAVSRFTSSYVEEIILRAGIYIILAVSLNLVNGFTGQFSIGHAAFFGIGAYTGAAFTVYGQATFLHGLAGSSGYNWWQGGLVLLVAMLLGGLCAAIAGFLLGLPSLNLRGDYLAIVTLGFNEIVKVIINNLDVVGASRGFQSIDSKTGLISIPYLSSFFWVYAVVVAAVVLSLNVKRSVHGLALLSVRENEVAAESMGVPTTRIKVTAFVISSFFAGIAGVLYAHTEGLIKPENFNFITSINIVVMVVLGGLGSVSGSVIAAVVLITVPELLRVIDQYRLVIYSMLLILLMLVRPQGIFGASELTNLFRRKRGVAQT